MQWQNTQASLQTNVTLQPGPFGFEELTAFTLESVPGWEGRLEWLQSSEEPNYRFLIIDPLLCRPDYDPKFDAAVLKALKLNRIDDAIVRCICRMGEDPRKMTANLLAPIVINPVLRSGRQVALQDERYSMRQPVFGEGDRGDDEVAAAESRSGQAAERGYTDAGAQPETE